jgi:hypothetical protein
MTIFAKVINELVVELIVADNNFIDSGAMGDPTLWIPTISSHKAKLASTYDILNNTFIPPNSNPSWVYNAESNQWQPPTAYPDDGKVYDWNEDTTNWTEIT